MKSSLAPRKISALDWGCLRAIEFYQRRISPRKGWRCAHARLHGGVGCSGFAQNAIAQFGLHAALPMIRARFAACKSSGQTLRAQVELDGLDGSNLDDKALPKRNWQHNLGDACCVDFGWVLCVDSLCDGTACEAASCGEAACGCHSCL